MVVSEWHLALCLISGERVRLLSERGRKSVKKHIQPKARIESERMVELGRGGGKKKGRSNKPDSL